MLKSIKVLATAGAIVAATSLASAFSSARSLTISTNLAEGLVGSPQTTANLGLTYTARDPAQALQRLTLVKNQTQQSDAKQWLNRYHDPSSLYVVFPNGQIFRARAKWTGILLGRMNLFHCFRYMPLRYREDEDVYLRGRVVQFLDADSNEIAAHYRTQCALKSFPGDPYRRVAPSRDEEGKQVQ